MRQLTRAYSELTAVTVTGNIPVVLWSEVSPVIGMLMMPKTCMYVWAVAMGYNEVKRNMISD